MRGPLICLTIYCTISFTTSALAQVATPAPAIPSETPAGLPTAYDVVSVRPHKEDNSGAVSYWRTTKSGFSADVTVWGLMTGAYDVMMEDQVSGLPGWARTENFDVEAKLDPENAEAVSKLHGEEGRNERAVLMKALLADRFKLKAHVMVKDFPVYDLVIAKGGLKMKEAAPDQPGGYGMGRSSIKGRAVSMGSLAGNLSHPAGRLILDKTGLTGRYQVDLTWASQDDPNATGPSLFTALEEQLGLKLEPAKEPLNVVVVDHIEKPTEN